MTGQDIEIQNLHEALKAAAYYIERLEMIQRRTRVRDLTEAMEHYHRVGPPLLVSGLVDEQTRCHNGWLRPAGLTREHQNLLRLSSEQ
jgi:hypothetical protein